MSGPKLLLFVIACIASPGHGNAAAGPCLLIRVLLRCALRLMQLDATEFLRRMTIICLEVGLLLG